MIEWVLLLSTMWANGDHTWDTIPTTGYQNCLELTEIVEDPSSYSEGVERINGYCSDEQKTINRWNQLRKSSEHFKK